MTNYEQLITLRWHFVEQQNTIKHGGWISGGMLEGANSSLSMALNSPKDKSVSCFWIIINVFLFCDILRNFKETLQQNYRSNIRNT